MYAHEKKDIGFLIFPGFPMAWDMKFSVGLLFLRMEAAPKLAHVFHLSLINLCAK
jgi:hypothetical protein